MELNLDLYLKVLREQRDQLSEANAICQAQVLDLLARNANLQKHLDDLLSAAQAPAEEAHAE